MLHAWRISDIVIATRTVTLHEGTRPGDAVEAGVAEQLVLCRHSSKIDAGQASTHDPHPCWKLFCQDGALCE